MELTPLPAGIADLLEALGAPPRLVAHLMLVHDVAHTLVARFDDAWPSLAYDRQAVLVGAASHDIGKIAHPRELTHPGPEHEAAGVDLLRAQGFSDELARFARTHEQWAAQPEPSLEDLLVALADRWWRGKRDEALEMALCRRITGDAHEAEWQVFLLLEEIASSITTDADARLAWQTLHAT